MAAFRHLLLLAASLRLIDAAPAQEPPLPKLGGPIVRDCAKEARERPDDIIVCGTRERSPYRLPEAPQRFDPGGTVDSVSRERHRLYEVGETGTHSCSPVGPGGWTGCTFKRWKDAREQYGK